MRPRLSGGPALAVILVATAIVVSMIFRAGNVVLAAEGMVILGCLLAAAAPPGLTRKDAVRWGGLQVPSLAAGAAVGGVALAALAARPADAAWIVLAGLAAAVAAYFVAMPR